MTPARGDSAIAAQRMVILSPNIATILLALDAGGKAVAAGPRAARLSGLAHLPCVSGESRVAVQQIIALRPDAILMEPQDLDSAAIATLSEAGLSVERFDPHSLTDVFDVIRATAKRVGAAEAGEQLLRQVSRDLARLSAGVLGQSRPGVVLALSREPLTLASDDHYATGLLEIAGGDAAIEKSGRRAISMTRAELARLAPQVLVDVTAQDGDLRDDSEIIDYWHNMLPETRVLLLPQALIFAWGDMPAAVRKIQPLLMQPAQTAAPR